MENEVTVFMQQGAPTRHADEQVGLNDDVYRDIRQLLEGRGHEVPDEPGMTPMVEALPVSAIRSLADSTTCTWARSATQRLNDLRARRGGRNTVLGKDSFPDPCTKRWPV